MKKSIIAITENLKSSFQRFPLTILLSSSLLIMLIILNEAITKLNPSQLETMSRISMTLGMVVILSVCLKLLYESIFNHNKTKLYVSYIIGIAFAFLFYRFALSSLEYAPIVKYVATILALSIAFFFIPKIKDNKSIEIYTLKVCNGFFTTLVYSGVLFLGLIAILFTTNTLFDMNIDSKYYYYIFLAVTLLFAVPFFLSKVPEIAESFEYYNYSKSLRILLLYIVVPLITIYTAILYTYFAKILITWQWPKGLVSHLVLWYSAISVGVIFLIFPLIEEYTVARLFRKWFPIVNIPVLCMMFASIGIRISQYGFTENRYFVVVLGLWVFFVMAYYTFCKDYKNEIILITLSAVFLISVFGPLSSFSISMSSQNKRLIEVLDENNMIENGKIIHSENIALTEKKAISSILDYFENHHSLQDVKILPNDFELAKMKNVFGFPFYENYEPLEQEYHFYYIDTFNEVIDIKEYDYYLNLNSWEDSGTRTVKEYSVEYNHSKNKIIISKDNSIEMELEILKYANLIHKNSTVPREILSATEMTFEETNQEINVKLIFNNLNLMLDSSEDIAVDDFEMILLLDI